MNNILQHISIIITEKCNLDCYHCYRNGINQSHYLNLSIWSKLSERIKDSNIRSIRITGGEPLLVENIEKLIFLFSRYGLRTSLATNGILLDSQKIRLLKDIGLNEIWVSIHSDNPEMHDRLAGKIGAFHLTLNAIKECIRQGIDINVNFPVSIYNIQDSLSTLRFLDSIGVNRIKLLSITPKGRASYGNNFKYIKDENWLGLVEKVRDIKFYNTEFKMQGCIPDSVSEGRCAIYPLKYLNIGTSGLLYPCCLLSACKDMEIGHISELLYGKWEQAICLLNERIKKIYKLGKGIPCISDDRKICPLYSKKIFCNNDKEY